MPSTSGSFAVYCSSYSSAGLKPFFRQMCVGIGRARKRRRRRSRRTPSRCREFTTPALDAGRALRGGRHQRRLGGVERRRRIRGRLLRGIISAAVVPVCPVKPDDQRPGDARAVRILRDRHLNRLIVAVGSTSPCQPLTSETWPSALAAGAPLPRFTTEYISTPLACVMSTGFISENVATYSTLPRALRGANWMSVMRAFFGSSGSSSP